MSAPLIWIVFPGLVAVLLYALRRYSPTIQIIGVILALILAWLAWIMPINQVFSLGRFPGLFSLKVGDAWMVLGRRFILPDSIRPVLVLIYLSVALWFGGSIVARTDTLFVPLGLGIAALLTATLAVEPFLYAALLIEIVALVSVPLLSPPGQPAGRGILRFITLQSLGMPFILFAGWLLTSAETDPNNATLVLRISLLVGLGFAFLISIFPFHTWIPMVSEEAHPYAAAFVFFVFPGIVSLFALSFLSRYPWLSNSAIVIQALQLTGTLMMITGGIWAAFQNHLGRILGYAVTMEIGLSLLALSLGFGVPVANATIPSLGIFFAQLLPRAISLAVWALALALIRIKAGDLHFDAVRGLAHEMPLASASIMLAMLSLAGFPLLAAFPIRIALWTGLAQQSLPIAILTLLGDAGLLAAGIRSLAVLVMGGDHDQSWRISERRAESGLLYLGWVLLFIVGLFPQWFYPYLMNVARLFAHSG